MFCLVFGHRQGWHSNAMNSRLFSTFNAQLYEMVKYLLSVMAGFSILLQNCGAVFGPKLSRLSTVRLSARMKVWTELWDAYGPSDNADENTIWRVFADKGNMLKTNYFASH